MAAFFTKHIELTNVVVVTLHESNSKAHGTAQLKVGVVYINLARRPNQLLTTSRRGVRGNTTLEVWDLPDVPSSTLHIKIQHT